MIATAIWSVIAGLLGILLCPVYIIVARRATNLRRRRYCTIAAIFWPLFGLNALTMIPQRSLSPGLQAAIVTTYLVLTIAFVLLTGFIGLKKIQMPRLTGIDTKR